MKRLSPKEHEAPTVKRKTIAAQILDLAKSKMKIHICSTAAYLYKSIEGQNPDYGADEACTINVSDLADDLFIDVLVSDTYLDEPVAKVVEVKKITCFLDDTFAVTTTDDEEYDCSELSIEACAKIADLLEISYHLRVQGRL